MISQSKPLDVVGMFRANVVFDKLTSVKEFYAVNCLNQPLLGWPTIKALDVLSASNSENEIFSTDFSGLDSSEK